MLFYCKTTWFVPRPAPASCRHCTQTPFSQALLTTDPRGLTAAHAGKGCLCGDGAHRSVLCWLATPLPTQTPGGGGNLSPHISARFRCFQVLFCVQTTQTRTAHSTDPPHRCTPASHCQGQTFSRPLDTFSECGLEAPCSPVAPGAEAMDTCLCVNPALETSPTPRAQSSAKRPSVSGSKSQKIRLK